MRIGVLVGVAGIAFASTDSARADVYLYTYVGDAAPQLTSPYGTPYNLDVPFFGYIDNAVFTAVYTVDTSKGQTISFPGPPPFIYSSLEPRFDGTSNPVGLKLTINGITENFDMSLPSAVGELNDTFKNGSLFGQYSFYQATIVGWESSVFVDSDTGGEIGQPLGGGVTLINSLGESVVNFTNASLVVTDISGVPEPSAWAMMLAGLSMAGWGLRRRRTLARRMEIGRV